MLIRLFALSEEQQNMMRSLSLVPVVGISGKYFQFLTATTDCDIINELDEIEHYGSRIQGTADRSEHLLNNHPSRFYIFLFDL